MLLSHQKRFIFVHNYKTGGTSVNVALSRYSDKSITGLSLIDKLIDYFGLAPKLYSNQFRQHVKVSELAQALPPEIFRSYYKFGFIRNPWDWQASEYAFILRETKHPYHSIVKNFTSFDEYIDWRVHDALQLQKDFFYDGHQCLVDYIGRFENIQKDFQEICSHIGIEATLPHRNRSRLDTDLSPYYTSKSLFIVLQAYASDIELFGYKMPQLR